MSDLQTVEDIKKEVKKLISYHIMDGNKAKILELIDDAYDFGVDDGEDTGETMGYKKGLKANSGDGECCEEAYKLGHEGGYELGYKEGYEVCQEFKDDTLDSVETYPCITCKGNVTFNEDAQKWECDTCDFALYGDDNGQS